MIENIFNKFSKGIKTAAKDFFAGGLNSYSIDPSQYRGDVKLDANGWLFDTAGNSMERFFSYNGLQDVVKSYNLCPPVSSIINKQAYSYINGKLLYKDANGTDVENEHVKKLKKLFKTPNYIQNNKQFEAQICIYLRLFGFCVIMPTKTLGAKNITASNMWVIPPYMCEFVENKQTFYNLQNGFINKIKVTYGNEVSYLYPEDIILLKDISPNFDSMYLPSSPIKQIQQNVNNLIGIYNSKGTLINYRGALGILTPEVDPNGAIAADPEEQEDLQNKMSRYGLKNGQWKFIIANSAMKWQQMGIPYRDLMLTEWAEDDTMVVCDCLNYPYKLLSNTKSSSMNGTEVLQYQKLLYQDFTIPFAEMISEQFDYAFETEQNGYTIKKDFSHVSALQEDDVKKATARLLLNQSMKIEYENSLITINEWLKHLGQPSIGVLGDTRANDIKNTNVPLASVIGVSGVQSFISVLTAAGISEEARANTLQILFGISETDAASMTQNTISTTVAQLN